MVHDEDVATERRRRRGAYGLEACRSSSGRHIVREGDVASVSVWSASMREEGRWAVEGIACRIVAAVVNGVGQYIVVSRWSVVAHKDAQTRCAREAHKTK